MLLRDAFENIAEVEEFLSFYSIHDLPEGAENRVLRSDQELELTDPAILGRDLVEVVRISDEECGAIHRTILDAVIAGEPIVTFESLRKIRH